MWFALRWGIGNVLPNNFLVTIKIGTIIRRLIFGRIIGVLIAHGLRGNLHQGTINNDQKQGHPPTDFQDNTETKSIENVPYK